MRLIPATPLAGLASACLEVKERCQGWKRLKMKWQTWCHTWAGFLGLWEDVSLASGSTHAPTQHPVCSGVLLPATGRDLPRPQ